MFNPKIFFVFLFILNPVYAMNVSWFENFNDPILYSYILKAVNCNKDVNIARKNILKYRQEKNLYISKEFPEINVGADYLLLKIPKTAIPRNDIQTNSFALPFYTIWEVDYLGKNYNAIQKAKLDIENAVLELELTAIIVATDTADAYLNISSLNNQIELQKKVKDLYENIYLRKQKMFNSGVISLLELNNSQNDYLMEANALKNLYKDREVFLTRLAYLINQSPYTVDEIEISNFENIDFTGQRPDFLKGDVILNRPDIKQKENEMKKAKIDITIAKKDFLPQITVLGVMVFSTVVQNFGWDGVFAALSAGAVQNLFDGGKRIFTLKKRKIEYDTKIQEYLKTDLIALKEVNDSLYKLKCDYEIFENQTKINEIENQNFIKIFKSYKSGTRDYMQYLNENSASIKQNIALVQAKNQNFINLLSLYKAVGGEL